MVGETSPDLVVPVYVTQLGQAFHCDGLALLEHLRSTPTKVQLVVTSPPFPLQREKEYGRPAFESEFVNWFLPFARLIYDVLSDDGSFVVDLGPVYVKGKPIRSLYNYRLLISLVDDVGFFLAQDVFWFNPAKLPSPIEWVNKRKLRLKDAVNTVWWLAKTECPKVRLERVYLRYSARMEALLRLGERFYRPADRPSGHQVSDRFMGLPTDKGAIPPNLLVVANTDSSSKWLRYCRSLGASINPSRFPEDLPRFFIEMLTDEGDLVLDPFAGSNVTGYVAETLGRRWLSSEIRLDYVVASALRFAQSEEHARSVYERLCQRVSWPVPLKREGIERTEPKTRSQLL